MTPGESQCALDVIFGQFHGGKDMAGGVVLRGASRAVGDGDDILERDHDRLGVKAGNGNVERAGDGFALIAGDDGSQLLESGERLLLEVLAVLRTFGVVADGDFSGFPDGNDKGDGEGARTETPFLPAAEGNGCEGGVFVAATAQNQGADALRGVNLVAADTDEIEARVLEIRDSFAKTLRGIHMEKRCMFAKSLGDVVQRLDDAGLVVHMHHGYEDGVWPQRGGDLVGGDRAVGARLEKCDFESVLRQEF